MAKTLRGARTLVVVRLKTDDVGPYYVRGVTFAGWAKAYDLSICILDIHDPSRRHVVLAHSTPGQIIRGEGDGVTVVDGKRYEEKDSPGGMVETALLGVVER
jgi:hypothetical protein